MSIQSCPLITYSPLSVSESVGWMLHLMLVKYNYGGHFYGFTVISLHWLGFIKTQPVTTDTWAKGAIKAY